MRRQTTSNPQKCGAIDTSPTAYPAFTASCPQLVEADIRPKRATSGGDPNRTLPHRSDCPVPCRCRAHFHEDHPTASSRKVATFQLDFCDFRSNRRELLQTLSPGQTRLLTPPCPPSPTHTLREGINVRFTAAKEFKKIQLTIFTRLAYAQQNHFILD